MRHMSNNRRGGRGKSNSGQKSVHPRYQNFESNGPDGRLRGTPSQVHEKFLQQARDALVSGDTVRSQNLLQYAEHYFRLGDLGGYGQGDRNSSQPEEGLSAQDQTEISNQDSHQDVAQPDSRRSASNRSASSREDAPRPRRERGARYGRGGRVNSNQAPEYKEEPRAPAKSSLDVSSEHQPGFGTQMPAFLGRGTSDVVGLGEENATLSNAADRSEVPSHDASNGEAESSKPARRSVRRTPYGPRRRPESRKTPDDA